MVIRGPRKKVVLLEQQPQEVARLSLSLEVPTRMMMMGQEGSCLRQFQCKLRDPLTYLLGPHARGLSNQKLDQTLMVLHSIISFEVFLSMFNLKFEYQSAVDQILIHFRTLLLLSPDLLFNQYSLMHFRLYCLNYFILHFRILMNQSQMKLLN